MGDSLTALRIVAVVQVRLGSTRLPGKALLDIAGRPMLAHLIERVLAIGDVDAVVLATTLSPRDEPLVEFARAAGLRCVRGSEDDLLDRFRLALQETPAAAVLRVTPDCPLIDPAVSSLVVREYLRRADAVDYVSNVHPPTYPDGLDTEIFSTAALETAWRVARLASDREHVTPYIWKHPERFRLANVAHREDLSHHRWTVDTPADLQFVRAVYERLNPDGRRLFGMEAVLELLRVEPGLLKLNAGQTRNEGYLRSVVADASSHAGPGRQAVR